MVVKCLSRRCSREGKVRGLCSRCYTAAWRAIDAGAITWEELVSTGRALNANVAALATDETGKCSTVGCLKLKISRGLCTVCYVRMLRKVKNGEITWDSKTETGT